MVIPTILDVLDRVYTGPKCTVREWDTKVIPSKTAGKMKEYKIKFDPDIVVPSDDTLIDDVFQAGFELAIETGVLCQDNERIIKFDEEELKDVIRGGPTKCYCGEGGDRVTIAQRKTEDPRPIVHTLGPFGISVSEDIFIPVHVAAAQCRYNDVLVQGILPTVYGYDVRAGTPYEVLNAYLEAALSKEAVRRAGRPGMPMICVCGNYTGIAQLAGLSPGYYTRNDLLTFPMPAELKTSYNSLNLAVQSSSHGSHGIPATHPLIGGYVGGAEGAAIMAVASMILIRVVSQSTIVQGLPTDIRTMGNTTREALWATSIAYQAMSRNTRLMTYTDVTGSLDVFTEPFLYETALCSAITQVSGPAMNMGVRSGGGRFRDHTTPLENHLMGEVGLYTAGMKRDDLKELAIKILPKYEHALLHPPEGKKFQEVMDLKTLKPKKEWKDMYLKVRKELVDIGLLPK